MLFLMLRLGDDRYALDTSRIVDVLPLVGLTKVLRAPPEIAGTLNYHGEFVPVIDLSVLLVGRPAPARLSTRIVVVRIAADDRDWSRLGLIAENATETMRCEPNDFVSPGLVSSETPFLGPVTVGKLGHVQRIEIDRLVPASAREFVGDRSAAVR